MKRYKIGDSVNLKSGRTGIIEDYDKDYYYVKDTQGCTRKVKKIKDDATTTILCWETDLHTATLKHIEGCIYTTTASKANRRLFGEVVFNNYDLIDAFDKAGVRFHMIADLYNTEHESTFENGVVTVYDKNDKVIEQYKIDEDYTNQDKRISPALDVETISEEDLISMIRENESNEPIVAETMDDNLIEAEVADKAITINPYENTERVKQGKYVAQVYKTEDGSYDVALFADSTFQLDTIHIEKAEDAKDATAQAIALWEDKSHLHDAKAIPFTLEELQEMLDKEYSFDTEIDGHELTIANSFKNGLYEVYDNSIGEIIMYMKPIEEVHNTLLNYKEIIEEFLKQKEEWAKKAEIDLKKKREALLACAEAVSKEPSMENIGELQARIDFYSDFYKDVYGVRPRQEIGGIYNSLSPEAKEEFEKFDALSWGEKENLMYGTSVRDSYTPWSGAKIDGYIENFTAEKLFNKAWDEQATQILINKAKDTIYLISIDGAYMADTEGWEYDDEDGFIVQMASQPAGEKIALDIEDDKNGKVLLETDWIPEDMAIEEIDKVLKSL